MLKKEVLLAYFLEIPNFLSIFIYPIFLISTSPILLDISKSLGINVNNLSFIFTFSIIGNIIGQLTSILYNFRFRKYIVILTGYILLIPIIAFLIFVKYLYLFYIIYFLSGYIFGVIWIQANAFLLESKIENKNQLINISLVFFPVGAAVAPLLNSMLLAIKLSWRYLYIIIIIFIFIVIVLFVLLKRKTASKRHSIEKINFKEIFILRGNNKIFLITVLALFFYGITEAIIYTWSPTFFRIDKLLNSQSAGLTLTIFWISICVGRIIISTILCRIKPNIMIFALTLVSIIALILVILVNSKYAIFIVIGLIGLGYSGIFSLLFSTGSIIYEKGRNLIETILFVVTGIGASITPWLTGLSSRYNNTFSIILAIIFMSIITILIIVHIFYYRLYFTNRKTC